MLATKTQKEKEDTYNILETQSDDGDYTTKNEWEQDSFFNEIDAMSRGSNTNSRFHHLQSKLISPFDKIMDDTLIRNSDEMIKASISKSVFVPTYLRYSSDPSYVGIKDQIIKKVNLLKSSLLLIFCYSRIVNVNG